jgi:hypothetical protein
MQRIATLVAVMLLLPMALFGFSRAQCPEDPNDHGECDTLNVICHDCEVDTAAGGPYFVRFPMLVTNDIVDNSIDSIASFVIPLTWTHTNPSAYCSLSLWWNTISTLWVFPDFNRSMFRHIVDGVDTVYHNRMADIAADFMGRDWDTRIVDLSTDPPFMGMALFPTGTADQLWWESDRVLLATMTFRIEDTMHVCIDTTFWPPSSNVSFIRTDGVSYVPRDNLPQCFWIGAEQPPDFTIEAEPDTQEVVAGNSVDYDVILTSLNGFSSTVGLSASGLPTDASASFDPEQVIPTDMSVMTISTAGTTPEGTYIITVTGTELTAAQIQHSTEVVLKVITPESMLVTAPDGGEEWCAGSNQSITWTSTGIDTVKIEYSTNGGSGWITEADKVPAAPGSYSWTIPEAPSTDCLVRICDAEDGAPCDQSDAVFTILALPAAPSDCVASDDLCDKVHFCWTDNSTNGTGFYIYRGGTRFDSVGVDVTCYDDFAATPGVTYEYCVTAYNDCGESDECCDSGAVLSLPAAPSDCIASDDLCDKVQFCWQDNSDDETGFHIYRDGSWLDSVGVDVTCYDDYSATPGVTYEYCVTAHNSCGESSQCCEEGARSVETIAVLAPNGGEEWCAGNIHDVTWTSTCTDTVKIDYSTDGGSSWITEADKVPAAPGSYSWTIPDAPSTNCLVKICDAEDGIPCDQSDTVFTICVEDFTIEVTPAARKVLAGNSIDYSVVLTSLYGFASSCSLTVTGLPADASGSFDPNPIVPTDTSLLTVNTSETTPPGFYDLTITATELGGGGIEHSTQVVLMVAGVEALIGDANGNGMVEPRDVVYLISYLFRDNPPPDPYEAGDTNCDGVVNPSDVIYLINYLFRNGPPPDC